MFGSVLNQGNMIEVINKDFRDCVIPEGLVITDPPYNQGYAYNKYKDKITDDDYIELLSHIPTPVSYTHLTLPTILLV